MLILLLQPFDRATEEVLKIETTASRYLLQKNSQPKYNYTKLLSIQCNKDHMI